MTFAAGAIIDVIVDLRVGSPSLATWKAVQLDDQTRRAVFISEGLGHAFAALSHEATVMYLCSTLYAPGIEHGVHPLDPALGITWPSPKLRQSASPAWSAFSYSAGDIMRSAECRRRVL